MNTNLAKPEVNDILYSLNIGNSARHREQKITPVIVVSVGRKYFSTKYKDSSTYQIETKYTLSDWREKTEYSANSRLYRTREQWNEEKESTDLYRKIKADYFDTFSNKQISLTTLRQIADLLRGD